MIKSILSRPIIIVMLCLWLVGVFARSLTGEINIVTWISEHRIMIGLIMAVIIIKYPLK